MSHLCRPLHCTDRMDEMGKHKSSFHSQEKTINCRQKVQRKRIEFLLREQNLFILLVNIKFMLEGGDVLKIRDFRTKNWNIILTQTKYQNRKVWAWKGKIINPNSRKYFIEQRNTESVEVQNNIFVWINWFSLQ